MRIAEYTNGKLNYREATDKEIIELKDMPMPAAEPTDTERIAELEAALEALVDGRTA